MLLEKAEMFINFSISMYKKNRIQVAIWATKESEKYLNLYEEGKKTNEN